MNSADILRAARALAAIPSPRSTICRRSQAALATSNRGAELFLGDERTTTLLGIRPIRGGAARSVLRRDRAQIFQALSDHDILTVHAAYGFGVAGSRAFEQLKLLRYHLDLLTFKSDEKRIVTDIVPWITAVYFTHGLEDLDERLARVLSRWLTKNRRLSIYPRILNPDAGTQGMQAVWSTFAAKYRHRFVDRLP